MSNANLDGKDLQEIGYPEAPVISIALDMLEKFYTDVAKMLSHYC